MLSIAVPFAEREDLELKKVGDELIVRAGREKRAIVLPSALSRHTPAGAKLEDGRLEISFDTRTPEPPDRGARPTPRTTPAEPAPEASGARRPGSEQRSLAPASGPRSEPGRPRGPVRRRRPAVDAWRALREGLGAASAAARRAGDGELQCLELCPICRAADLLRATGPPELRGQLSEFQREALLTLRALLDHYIERLDEPPEPGERVEDIPIG